MRCPFQEGDFPFPVKYGYAAVGRVEVGPEPLEGRVVFCLHPHQTAFIVPATAATPLPDGLPAERAVLAANLETALNAVGTPESCPVIASSCSVLASSAPSSGGWPAAFPARR